MKREQYMLAGAVKRMLMRQLSMAFEKWQYEAACMKREREMLDKALRRFIHAKLFAAWNMWRSWAAEMRRQAYIMGGAANRMLKRQLSIYACSYCFVRRCSFFAKSCVRNIAR